MGTTDGTAASELYNERTLVLTRAFVKRACEYPPMNFSREIAAYYYNGFPGSEQAGGALQGIIEQSRLLLEESERWHAEQDKREGAGDAAEDVRQPPKSGVVPSQRILTEGAGLSLCVAHFSCLPLVIPVTLTCLPLLTGGERSRRSKTCKSEARSSTSRKQHDPPSLAHRPRPRPRRFSHPHTYTHNLQFRTEHS